jgi:hypothetical protein
LDFLHVRKEYLDSVYAQTVKPRVFAEKLHLPQSIEEVLGGIIDGFQSCFSAMETYMQRQKANNEFHLQTRDSVIA